MTTTTAYQGRGSHLDSSTDGVTFTRIAQLQKFNFSGMQAQFEDITNLDSPTIFKEWIKTIVDAKDVQFSGVLNPADPTTQDLMTQLQTAGSASLRYFRIVLPQGSVISFQAFVSEYNPVSVDYAKALYFNGKLMIVGSVAAAW